MQGATASTALNLVLSLHTNMKICILLGGVEARSKQF